MSFIPIETGTGNAKFITPITPYGGLMVPMGEISYFSTTGTVITIAAQSDGSTNMVVVNPITSVAANSFEHDNGGANNGRLQYTGATTKMFHVACSLSISSTNNILFILGVAKNGSIISSSKMINKIGTAGDTISTAIHIMVELATNEYLEFYVGNLSGTENCTVKTLCLVTVGM